MRAFLSSLLLLCFLSTFSFGQSIDHARQKKKNLENEISKIDRQLSNTQKKKESNLYNLSLTQKKISYRKKLISEINGNISSYNSQILEKDQEIKRLNSRLDTLEYYFNKFYLNAYKNRDTKVWFMYILASDNIGQGLRRWSYLKNMNRSIERQAKAIRSTQEDITEQTQKLQNLKDQSITSKKEKQDEYNRLKMDEAAFSRTIQNLKNQEKKIRKQLQEKKKEVEKLNQKIEQILAEEIKRQQKEQAKGSSKNAQVNIKLSGEFANNKKKLPWPVEGGVVVQPYGQSYHPVFKSLKLPFNNGIDISAAKGSKATCVFDGEVKQILIMPGYSQCILVQHGEYFTFYCKLKTVSVKTGQKVKLGQVLGTIDTAENGNAVLHFQLWKGTVKQNPEYWLR